MAGAMILMLLLRSAILGNELDTTVLSKGTQETWNSLFALATKHDLAHLISYSLEKCNLLQCGTLTKFKKAKSQAIYRYLRMEREYKHLCNTFEAAKIPFIPLKGTVLRTYYPEPWMRTSCDIDILVQEESLEEAAEALVTQLDYTRGKKSNHDISLTSPSGVHLELHYRAVDEGRFLDAQAILDRIWQVAVPTGEGAYQRVLSDEMFYFCHIVHMAKHIENGGCGIRPFLDLWILNYRFPYNQEKRDELLEDGNLMKFASAVEKLSEVWFSDAQSDDMTQRLERYVLSGGTYGILENQVCVNQSKLGGKAEYALQKIFLPYDRIKYHYPILQKYRILTPIFEVIRWIKLLFKGGVKRSIQELHVNEVVAQKGSNEVKVLLEYLGL